MPEVIFYNEISIDRRYAKKIAIAIDAAAATMAKGERMRLTIIDDIFVVETEGQETRIELKEGV